MSIVTAMITILIFVILRTTWANMELRTVSMMHTIAEAPAPKENPAELAEERTIPYFSLYYDDDGKVVRTEGNYYDLSDEEFLEELIKTVNSLSEPEGMLREYGLYYLRRDFKEEKQRRGTEIDRIEAESLDQNRTEFEIYRMDESESMPDRVIVFADITRETGMMRLLTRTCILIGMAGAAVFLVISILLARWAVHPVEKAWEQQTRFVSDASHDLKTPLTVILTNIELLKTPGFSEEEKQKFIQSIEMMSDQMKGMVTELLDLARLDHEEKKQLSTLPLMELTEQAALPFEAMFYERGLRLEITGDRKLKAVGIEKDYRRILEILLDNAYKYALDQSEVKIEVLEEGSRNCMLCVSNKGQLLSEKECREIFRRFYRRDPARSMDHSYGLGLSIAEQLAHRQRGKIWARCSEDRIFFCLRLKKAQGKTESTAITPDL